MCVCVTCERAWQAGTQRPRKGKVEILPSGSGFRRPRTSRGRDCPGSSGLAPGVTGAGC